MKIIRPLQLGFNNRVLEHNRRFYFTASATIGVNIRTGEALLEFDYLKGTLESMGESAIPDMGMPKPIGEYLVSGVFYPPNKEKVHAGEVLVKVGRKQKALYIFGPRRWQNGIPTRPEKIASLSLDYKRAFGGGKFKRNPTGMGFKDGMLPCIENPAQLVASPNDSPEPSGFSSFDPSWPQRMRFSGTYDENYKLKYFPGYPEDFNWRYFLCAPEDQWNEGFYNGDESFELHNLHPELAVIKGTLPGLYARCFIKHKVQSGDIRFSELPLNLDTIWFFPDKTLALMIWRGVIEVQDDEAEGITHLLAAYEDRAQPPRNLDHYHAALEKRESSDNSLLTNFQTEDLIPIGAKCAMELLQEKALANVEKGEFAKNLDAKADSMKKMVNEKIEEVSKQTQKNLKGMDVPDEFKAFIADDGGIDLKKMVGKQSEIKPDPDVVALNKELESILPGITSTDPKNIKLKDFSFDKIGKITGAVDEFTQEKVRQGKEIAAEQITKAKQQAKEQMANMGGGTDQMAEEARKNLEENLKMLNELDAKAPPKGPLPRINLEEVVGALSKLSPNLTEAMQHLDGMKTLGIEDENTRKIKAQVKGLMESESGGIEKGLIKAQEEFKKVYIMSAHLLKDGVSPHKDAVETVAEILMKAIAEGKDVSGGDWACLDLGGKNLEGVDLSGAFLEQVNLKGASLKGANLSKAILARANLENADLSGANLSEANVGGVKARGAKFTGANLKSAKLSKGDFSEADFTDCELEGAECMEIKIKAAKFSGAHMPGIKYIECEIHGARFLKADMGSTSFLNCDIQDTDFSGANLTRCIWANTKLKNVCFNDADMTSSCFAATDPQKALMEKLSLMGAILIQCNFQNMGMPGANLKNSNMENANFNGVDLSEANLSGAFAKSAQFRKARLFGAKLNNINLMAGSLAKAYLVNASFVGANLFSVDFLRSTITNADFRGSNLEATLIEDWRPQ